MGYDANFVSFISENSETDGEGIIGSYRVVGNQAFFTWFKKLEEVLEYLGPIILWTLKDGHGPVIAFVGIRK